MNACLRVEADLLTSKFLFFVFFQATNLSRTMKRCLIKIENCKFTKANLSINFLHLHTQLDSSSWELIAQTVIVALSSRSRLSARVSVENTLKECGMIVHLHSDNYGLWWFQRRRRENSDVHLAGRSLSGLENIVNCQEF